MCDGHCLVLVTGTGFVLLKHQFGYVRTVLIGHHCSLALV